MTNPDPTAETEQWLREHPESAAASDKGFKAIDEGRYTEVRMTDTAKQAERTWRLKPEPRGHIRTTIQLLVDGGWEDAYEGADASTAAMLANILNHLEVKAKGLEQALERIAVGEWEGHPAPWAWVIAREALAKYREAGGGDERP